VTETNIRGGWGIHDAAISAGVNKAIEFLNDRRVLERKSINDKWLCDQAQPSKVT